MAIGLAESEIDMPNVCVIASANGDIEPLEVDEWPTMEFIQRAVGGLFAEVPTRFKLKFDDTWGAEVPAQETVVYCNESASLKSMPVNTTPIAAAINKSLGQHGPLLGDLLIVSGDVFFMATQD